MMDKLALVSMIRIRYRNESFSSMGRSSNSCLPNTRHRTAKSDDDAEVGAEISVSRLKLL